MDLYNAKASMLSVSEPEDSTGTQQLKMRWKKTENKSSSLEIKHFHTSLGRGGDKTPHQ